MSLLFLLPSSLSSSAAAAAEEQQESPLLLPPPLLLSDRTPGMSEYFRLIGYPVPPETNPAGVALKCALFHVVPMR